MFLFKCRSSHLQISSHYGSTLNLSCSSPDTGPHRVYHVPLQMQIQPFANFISYYGSTLNLSCSSPDTGPHRVYHVPLQMQIQPFANFISYYGSTLNLSCSSQIRATAWWPSG
ncbi:hypothetical protein CEXT_355241 [Caerostris extrusa]|uniref:Uncharacterized protein n=1 Tax=Caerostris extrusa TaxID=172846 RepID=A0AAV4NRK9_CAEEX|nr:hypothetical protein CEXT_355241 [Caerostris extrusa]